MLLYNEDILDILDQAIYLKHGMKPRYNCALAYLLQPYTAIKALELTMKETEKKKYAN